MEGMTRAYPVDAYAIELTLTEDGEAGVKLGFVQNGNSEQLILVMSNALAWAIASKILYLTESEPIRPGEDGWDDV